jgi:hypothetical protein
VYSVTAVWIGETIIGYRTSIGKLFLNTQERHGDERTILKWIWKKYVM